ncbi:hypothetical protein Bca4012_070354 [Brassica carinata]|uniref:Reverse transcriptase zinc-binding domain-containing protein n=1 Tax=Brassica oleracea TaxID=3712 RepID=A0A3P6EXI4_BRAOL|nr:unnamed protein product [Brassica oleracea]
MHPESRNHLFFDCAFSFELWSRLSTRCCLAPVSSWEQTVAQMGSLRGGKAVTLISLLVWQATLYWIWNERNGRIHARPFRTVGVIYKAIDHQIRNKISSFRDTSPSLSSKMMQQWFSTA